MLGICQPVHNADSLMPRPLDPMNSFTAVYDAWNRLAKVNKAWRDGPGAIRNDDRGDASRRPRAADQQGGAALANVDMSRRDV
jgi:hypothetical protein